MDSELGPRLGSMGDQQTAQAAALIAQRLDAASCVKRHRKAVSDRRVSIRPAPDTMAYVTALLPVAQVSRCTPRSPGTPTPVLPPVTPAAGAR